MVYSILYLVSTSSGSVNPTLDGRPISEHEHFLFTTLYTSRFSNTSLIITFSVRTGIFDGMAGQILPQ